MPIDQILNNPSSQDREDPRDGGKGNTIIVVEHQAPTETVRDAGQAQVNPAL